MDNSTHQTMARIRQQGFTLLEVLVVLVIIGVMISVATLSMGVMGRDTEVQDQAERLATILSQAQEEAELQGQQFGVIVDSDGYEFLRFDAKTQGWLPISDDDLLGNRKFPEGLMISLWLEARKVILKPRSERAIEPVEPAEKEAEKSELDKDAPVKKASGLFGTKDSTDLKPQIFLLSSGEVNSFELHIEREQTDHVWRVMSKPDNTLLAEEFDANK